MSYLKIFFRRKEFLIIPAFLGLVLGISAGILLPKQYESTSVILVEEGKSDNPLFSKLAVSTTISQRLATIRESMLGWNSLVKLVKRLGLDEGIENTKQFENLILSIRNHISISLKGNQVLKVSYMGNNPIQTQQVVKTITDIFIERNMEIQNKETQDAIVFIEQQLKIYKGKIKSAEIAKMQEKLNALLVDSTERHPMVKELRERIAAKRAELEKDNLQFTEPEVIETESTNPLIDSIKKALDSMEGERTSASAEAPGADVKANDVYGMVMIETLGKVLARDAKVNESIYNMLLQRLETAKITQRLQDSKEGTRYTIIEPPRIPLEPSKPDKTLVALAGMFVGILLGFGLIFMTEFLDQSFIDVEEAKEFLGAPLLGAISKINTSETLRAERDRLRWMYSLTVVAGALILVITFTVHNYFK